MKIDKVHPQLRKNVRRFPPIPLYNSIVLAIFRRLMRLQPKAKKMFGVSITERRHNNAHLRIYRPAGDLSGAGMLWIHGGGYVIGSNSMNDQDCSRYARDLKIVVISAGYRLAPEYPFPCALDDCFEAWQWLQSNARDLGIASDRIVISGQSAGGGLAAGLAQRILDEGGIQPAGQALFYPMIDDRTAARRELDAINHRVWNNKNNRFGWASYLGHSPGMSEVAQYAVPARRDNLSGLPATWIGVGDLDLFYEENRLYAPRLSEAGVSCQLKVVTGAPHYFEALVPNAPISQEFMESYYQFLREVLKLNHF